MKTSLFQVTITAFISVMLPISAMADLAPHGFKIDDEYEIVQSYETSEKSEDGSSGSSSGHDVLLERVIAISENGIEFEYDVPTDEKHSKGLKQWQFPARIFKPFNGPPQLLNAAELELRADRFLKKAKLNRKACGQWIFTWNAFQVECDPKSVIEIIEQYDLGSCNLDDGVKFQIPGAVQAEGMRKKTTAPDATVFVVQLQVDPEYIRRAQAESDVVVGKIVGQPITFDQALSMHSADKITGDIEVTLEPDTEGCVKRRTIYTKMEVSELKGKRETREKTVILERRLLAMPKRPA